MTEIQVYKSFIEADGALEHYCRQNLDNEFLVEDRLEKIPEEVKLENLNIAEDITFNFLFGLGSPRGVGPKYDAIIGLYYIISNGFCAGISLEALVKNIRKSMDVQHAYGVVGAKANPIFYTVEKEPGVLKSVKRLQEMRREDVPLTLACIVEFGSRGLNTEERDEFTKLWDQ